MAAQIESNQFPFMVAPFNVGPGRAFSQFVLTQQIRPSTGPSKQAPLIEPPFLLFSGCVVEYILYAGQKLCPVVMKCIKSPRLRQTFDRDRKSTRLNSSHVANSYAVFCLNKKKPSNSSQRR